MKITKLGHCAMIIEHEGVRLLTDPGSFTTEAQAGQTGLHGVLITHEHQDHLHIDSLKQVLLQNPIAVVIGNSAVAKVIGESIADTAVVVVGDGQSSDINGLSIEGFGKDHALVYPPSIGLVENTGYLVGGAFYFPGDNFHQPGRKVDVLALPIAGPWMKISEAIDFAKAVNPRISFGVHDGMIRPEFNFNAMMAEHLLGSFVTLKDGETREF